MICHNCGEQLPDESRFCQRCGAPVQNGTVPPYGNVNQTPPCYNNAPPMGIEQRDIAITIILSIVTCGIYGLIWLAKMNDELNRLSGRTDDFSGGVVVLLSLLTGGLFGVYWAYKAGEKLNAVKAVRGLPTDSNIGIIYLLLNLFRLSIVTYALVQSELNRFADR